MRITAIGSGLAVALLLLEGCHYFRTSRLVAALDVNGQEVFSEHKAEVQHVSMSPGGRYLASADKDYVLIVRDLKKRRYWQRALEPIKQRFDIKEPGNSAFSQNGKLLAVSNTGVLDKAGKPMFPIYIFEPETGKQLQTLWAAYTVSSMLFDLDGHLLENSWTSNGITQWDIKTGKKIRTFQGFCGDGHYSKFALLADSKALVAMGNGFVHVWNYENGEKRYAQSRGGNSLPFSQYFFYSDGSRREIHEGQARTVEEDVLFREMVQEGLLPRPGAIMALCNKVYPPYITTLVTDDVPSLGSDARGKEIQLWVSDPYGSLITKRYGIKTTVPPRFSKWFGWGPMFPCAVIPEKLLIAHAEENNIHLGKFEPRPLE